MTDSRNSCDENFAPMEKHVSPHTPQEIYNQCNLVLFKFLGGCGGFFLFLSMVFVTDPLVYRRVQKSVDFVKVMVTSLGWGVPLSRKRSKRKSCDLYSCEHGVSCFRRIGSWFLSR